MIETVETAAERGQSLKLTRVIKASRGRVFEAWTDPRMMTKWFGTPTTTALGVTMDLQVGGRYSVEMAGGGADKAGEKTVMRVEGVYREIVPVERLSFTWNAVWSPDETLVTVSLREVAEGTEVTLTHSGFSDESSVKAHNSGWESSLEKLAKVVESA